MRARTVLTLALLATALAGYAWEVTHVWFSTNDTRDLLLGVGVADRCLHAGVYRDCNAAGFGDVSHFALLQYLPALLLKRLGASINTAYKELCWLNGVAVLAVLALMWHSGRRLGGHAVGILLLLAGIASPLLWYGHAGFGEPLAATAAAAFAAGLALGWPPLLTSLALVLAVISKEPILPVLALVAAAIVVARPGPARTGRSELLALGGGAVAALVASAAFNSFRFGQVTNAFYLDNAVHPPLADRGSAFAAMLVAPNVGMLWFWPAACAVALLGVIGARCGQRRSLTLLGAAFVVLLVGLASFWGPFGWEAWGPRLLLPWIPAFLIALAAVAGPRLLPAGLGGHAATALALVVVVLAIPQMAAFRHWHVAFDLFRPGPSCPYRLPEIREYQAVFGDTTGYYRCLRRQAWTHAPVLAAAIGKLKVDDAKWAIAFAGCLLLLARDAGLVREPAPLRRGSWA